MEFSEKLQQLRKEKELTQEQLAEQLFVSRTAVSKWESGRGLPSIDSLKAISKAFGITIDELLSGDEIIQAAEEEKKKDILSFNIMIFGIFDVLSLLFFVIPLFGDQREDYIKSVSLFSLQNIQKYILFTYIIIIIFNVIYGIAEILLQNCQLYLWKKYSLFVSVFITVVGILFFILSKQPYIAVMDLWVLIVKGAVLIKQR